MYILLIHIDGKIPNLALMKLSAWHKARGDEVKLLRGSIAGLWAHVKFDKTYISCVFEQNARDAQKLVSLFSDVQVGGYGFNGAKLPDEIEHTMPNYSLYGCDFSMGFTSRGCIRNCEFCIVPEKEGPICDHAPVSEFLHPGHNKVILLDNNFLASPMWKENLQFIIDHDLKVNFNQGLDIRLVNDENAAMLAECKFYNWHFKCRQLHFAFDLPEIEPEVRRGVGILGDNGIKPRNLMFYELVGERTTFEQDIHRFEVLRELGVDPFVMIYNNRRDRPELRHFARWVNKRIYKSCDLRDYDHGNSLEILQGVA